MERVCLESLQAILRENFGPQNYVLEGVTVILDQNMTTTKVAVFKASETYYRVQYRRDLVVEFIPFIGVLPFLGQTKKIPAKEITVVCCEQLGGEPQIIEIASVYRKVSQLTFGAGRANFKLSNVTKVYDVYYAHGEMRGFAFIVKYEDKYYNISIDGVLEIPERYVYSILEV